VFTILGAVGIFVDMCALTYFTFKYHLPLKKQIKLEENNITMFKEINQKSQNIVKKEDNQSKINQSHCQSQDPYNNAYSNNLNNHSNQDLKNHQI